MAYACLCSWMVNLGPVVDLLSTGCEGQTYVPE